MRLRAFWHIFIEGALTCLGANIAGLRWQRQVGRAAIVCLHQDTRVKHSGVMCVGYADLLGRRRAGTRSAQASASEGQLAGLKWSVLVIRICFGTSSFT